MIRNFRILLLVFLSGLFLSLTTGCDNSTEPTKRAVLMAPLPVWFSFTEETLLYNGDAGTTKLEDDADYHSDCDCGLKMLGHKLYFLHAWATADFPEDSIGHIDPSRDRMSYLFSPWWPEEYGFTEIDNVLPNQIDTDWAEVKMDLKDSFLSISVDFQENNTGKYRALFLHLFGSHAWTDGASSQTNTPILIVQAPKGVKESVPMKARYKGKTYETTADWMYDGTVSYDNQEFADLMKMLDSHEDVQIVVMEDDVVDYFDAEDFATNPMLAAIDSSCPAGTRCKPLGLDFGTRAGNPFIDMDPDAVAYCALFDDNSFTDTRFTKNTFSAWTVFDLYDMHDVGLNDKVSSIAVAYNGDKEDVCAILTVWEDIHFNNGDNDRKKHRISFLTTAANRSVKFSNLSGIKCKDSSKSWNDRISSFAFHCALMGKSFPEL